MLPKTFNIRLKLFETFGRNTYSFNLHARDHEEALAWVERVFPGLDTKTTRKRWKQNSAKPRVGTVDQVTLMDCDAFRRQRIVAGKRVAEAAEPGEFRKSEDEVAQGLFEVLTHLQEDRDTLLRSAKSLEAFLKNKTAKGYEGYAGRVELLRKLVAPVLKWQNNLWQEYYRLATELEQLA